MKSMQESLFNRDFGFVKRFSLTLTLTLLFLISSSPATTCDEPPDQSCMVQYFGIINISSEGDYIPDNSIAVGINNDIMPGSSDSDCFVKVINVLSDGNSECVDPSTGAGILCSAGLNLKMVTPEDAYSGAYTILGDAIQYTGVDDDDDGFDDITSIPLPNLNNGNYTVVDVDWEIIGVNEANEVEQRFIVRRRELPDYTSVLTRVKFTLVRSCDHIELVSGINCKKDKLFYVDYEVLGGEKDTVYEMNVVGRGFTPCEFFVIDYGKFYNNPGIYFVLLNRSKFGTNRGLSYYSIIGQEDSTRQIEHLYEESIRPSSFLNPSDLVCCQSVIGGSVIPNYRCSSHDECVACSFADTCSGVAPNNCFDATPRCCGYDCAIWDVRPLREVENSILIWNREAGERILGCDSCEVGDLTCSMGSSLTAYYAIMGISYYPPWNPERYCGYYRVPTPTQPPCDCTTGAGCNDEKQCMECARDGYGCEYDTVGPLLLDRCVGCHYSIEPTGQPEQSVIDYSIKSIETNISEYLVTWSEWWCSACSQNTVGADDGPWERIRGEEEDCSGPDGAEDIACSFYDCKVPWSCSAGPGDDTWDYSTRAGGVGYLYYTAIANLNDSDYLTDVDKTNCSDYVVGTGGFLRDVAPAYLNDRYTKCYKESVGTDGWRCNCTRPEHDPKEHTKCACPSGDDPDCCIEYVDDDSPQTLKIKEDEYGEGCSGTPDDLHCYFYGEVEMGASLCTCEEAFGTCGDDYCSVVSEEKPTNCPADCNHCEPAPCNDNSACDADEHYSWCEDCLCEDPPCDFSSDDTDPMACTGDVYVPQYNTAGTSGGNPFNKCPCGDGICFAKYNENIETCPDDCDYPDGYEGDGICWAPDGENWWNHGLPCWDYVGNWDDGCAYVDCPLPPGENGDGICQYWNGEWEGGENEDFQEVSDISSCGSSDCCGPADPFCDDTDGVCRTDRGEDETCSDCADYDTPCNFDGEWEYTCCDFWCPDLDGNPTIPCSAVGPPTWIMHNNPQVCGAGDPDQCPDSPQWIGCDYYGDADPDPGDGSDNRETEANCPSDCFDGSRCDGDGECEPFYGESGASCSDCETNPTCVENGICEVEFGENVENCNADCIIDQGNDIGDCLDGDGVCWWDTFTGVDEPGFENHDTCWDEDSKTGDCPRPVGTCGDGLCWPYPPIKDENHRCYDTGYEDGSCCPEDCAPGATCGDGVCEESEDCKQCEADCPFPPAEDDDVCQWWAGETEADDSDACEAPTSGDTEYICSGTPPRCCVCPEATFDTSYYRIFTRESVWANTFKITPEVSNSTIGDCTEEITCTQSKDSWVAYYQARIGPGPFPPPLCYLNASDVVCGGCHGGSTNCYNCNDLDGSPILTSCSEYIISAIMCDVDPCGVAKVPGGVKYGGCYASSSGCADCADIWGQGCEVYGNDGRSCENDPCMLGDCTWNPQAGSCADEKTRIYECEDLCPGGTCPGGAGNEPTNCVNASKLTNNGCTYSDNGGGYECFSCDEVDNCAMTYPAVCEQNTCQELKCWLDTDSGLCKECSGIQHIGKCSAYTNIDDCVRNPCSLSNKCAWGEEDSCVSCSLINSCADYFKPCAPPAGVCSWDPTGSCGACYPDNPLGGKGWGAACTSDPCGVGPCGLADLNPGLGEAWACLVRGEYAFGCYDAVYSLPADQEREMCIRSATNLTLGGCYFDYTDEACYSCQGKEALSPDAAEADNFPIPRCENYDGGILIAPLDNDFQNCLEDLCNVGPCYWDITRRRGDRCKKAFSAIPAEDNTGWIRSGGSGGEVDTNQIEGNAGGGPFWAHAGAGANIPNRSEAWGDESPADEVCADYRPNSIWSESKNYKTVRENICFGEEDPILNACDSRTVDCSGWQGDIRVRDVDENRPQRRIIEPIGAHVADDGVGDPPYACGTLCGKYVAQVYTGLTPEYPNEYWWPYWDWTNNEYLDSSYNITINETSLSGTNELTITELYYRYAILSGSAPNPEGGNILPRPGQPYTIFNWFNMPPNTGGGFSLEDDTYNISIGGNYTVNMSLYRVPMSMQCLWDGCLPDTSPSRQRTVNGHCEHQVNCGSSCTLAEPDCDPIFEDVCNPDPGVPYPNRWNKCEEWQEEILGGIPCQKRCWCETPDITWYFRCVACWLYEDCSYPVGPNDQIDTVEGVWNETFENVNDSSDVQARPYGENLTVARPLGDSDSHVAIDIRGYVDVGDPYGVKGHITINATPDLINGFTLLFPGMVRLKHTAKYYPAEHDLTRLKIGEAWDDCPRAATDLVCAGSAGYINFNPVPPWLTGTNRNAINCNDYKNYWILEPPEELSQVLTCLDEPTKREISRLAPMRQSGNPYLFVLNNPLKKYYYFVDRYDAHDKEYTTRVGVHGIDAGVAFFDITWSEVSKNVGILRNFHEDEMFYYDMAAINRQPRDYSVQSFEIVPEVEGGRLRRRTNVDSVQLDYKTLMDGEVIYNEKFQTYTFEFWSENIDTSIAGAPQLIIFTNFRNYQTSLFGTGSGDISVSINQRTMVSISCSPSQAAAFTIIDFSCTMGPLPPNNRMYVKFLPPYDQYSRVISSGDTISIDTLRSGIVATVTYDGYYSGTPSGNYAEAEWTHQMLVTSTGAMSFLARAILIFILAFMILVGYRWFIRDRLDFEMMLKESGIYETLQDFLGLK